MQEPTPPPAPTTTVAARMNGIGATTVATASFTKRQLRRNDTIIHPGSFRISPCYDVEEVGTAHDDEADTMQRGLQQRAARKV